jgi:Uncharacterized conserved protein (DUF2203)
VDEARAYLPRLRQLLRVIRRSARLSSRARSNGSGGADEPRDGESEPGAKSPGDAEDVLAAPSAVEALSEIEERGIVLRDLESGLVDFPSRHPDGRQVLLCWQLDEPDLAWWHLPEDGFAGRRPLPLPPHL